VFPRRVINKCPAIIFADNRIASVPGRITFLMVSMHTMNGISTGGVPCGTRCANMCTVLLIHPNTIKVNHRGSASVKVITMCLDLVKIYGNRPRKLLNMMSLNSDTIIKVDPLRINQNLDGIIINPIVVLNQFNDIDQLDEGSKEENRFIIIFS
jgi:hypothetical protein